jgi:hypothetical protein
VRILVVACFQKDTHNFRESFGSGFVQRTSAIRMYSVYVGPTRDQESHDLGLPVKDSLVERTVLASVQFVDAGMMVEKHLDDLNIAPARGEMYGHLIVPVRNLLIGPRFEQQLDNSGTARENRIVQCS